MVLLGALLPSPERDRHELDLRIALGMAWLALQGWAAPEVWTSLHPALGLAKSLGRRTALLPIYYGLWNNVEVQGRITESLDWANDMLVTAEASGDVELLVVAHRVACDTYFWRGDFTQSWVHGEQVLALYDEEQHRNVADLLHKGVAWLQGGRLADGIPHLRSALDTWTTHGAKIGMPCLLTILAEGLTLSGDCKGGLRLIEESLAQIARPGWEERWYLAETLRLKGWMLALQGNLAGAEQQYLASLDWAREQQAKSWELRTATSLARLWQRQRKKKREHKLLLEIYGWFTEGFDTKDLQEAKTLLEALSH